MPRIKQTEARVKFTLSLPRSLRDRLDEIRVRTEADSITEVVRRALAVYDVLLSRTAQGARIYLRDDDDGESELLI